MGAAVSILASGPTRSGRIGVRPLTHQLPGNDPSNRTGPTPTILRKLKIQHERRWWVA